MKMLVADFDSIPEMEANEGCVVEFGGEQFIVGFIDEDEEPIPGSSDLRVVLFEIENGAANSAPASPSFREFVEQNSDKFEPV